MIPLANWTTSLRKEVHRNAAADPQRGACRVTSVELPVEEVEAALSAVLAGGGHGGGGVRREGPPPFLSMITLRTPWEWFLSAVNWVSRSRVSSAQQEIWLLRLNLSAVLTFQYIVVPQVLNVQGIFELYGKYYDRRNTDMPLWDKPALAALLTSAR
jgi:hypothetical protein